MEKAWFLNPVKQVIFLRDYDCSSVSGEKIKKGEIFLLHCSDKHAYLILSHKSPIEVLDMGKDVVLYEPNSIKKGLYNLKKQSIVIKNLFSNFLRKID